MQGRVANLKRDQSFLYYLAFQAFKGKILIFFLCISFCSFLFIYAILQCCVFSKFLMTETLNAKAAIQEVHLAQYSVPSSDCLGGCKNRSHFQWCSLYIFSRPLAIWKFLWYLLVVV